LLDNLQNYTKKGMDVASNEEKSISAPAVVKEKCPVACKQLREVE
jgi:hypothetical protein